MSVTSLLPQLLLLGAAAVLAAVLFGTAALWAAAGRLGWLWRAAPILLLLAALVPIGAYELIALFGTQTAVVIGGVWTGYFWTDCRRARRLGRGRRQVLGDVAGRLWGGGPRFPLRDLLKGVLLAAGVLAIIRNAAVGAAANGGSSIDYLAWIAAGIGTGVITLIAEWMVFGSTRWHVRVLVSPVVMAAAAAALELFEPALVPISASLFLWPDAPTGANAVTPAAFSFAMVIWLVLVRAARWRWLWRDADDCESDDTKSQRRVRWRGAWRWAARGAMCAMLPLGISASGVLYLALLPPIPPQITLPNPNGFDEIMLASKGLNWTAIPIEDVEAAGIDACQAFVRTNAEPLAKARQALAIPSRNPVVFDATYFSTTTLARVQGFRSICRALVAEAKLATAEGRYWDAMCSNVDILRLAPALANGGLWVDDLVADALVSVGVAGLVSELPQLDAQQLESLANVLDALQDAREPVAPIQQREKIWDRLSYGWTGRFWFWAGEVTTGGFDANKRAVVDARRRCDALLRLILAEAAVRRYVLEQGSPPESLTSLVPDYFSAVPEDPYGAGPLVYRRTAEGYLLYSVGADGIDDGGQRVTFYEATTGDKGDLFYDASMDEPENDATGDDNPENPDE